MLIQCVLFISIKCKVHYINYHFYDYYFHLVPRVSSHRRYHCSNIPLKTKNKKNLAHHQIHVAYPRLPYLFLNGLKAKRNKSKQLQIITCLLSHAFHLCKIMCDHSLCHILSVQTKPVHKNSHQEKGIANSERRLHYQTMNEFTVFIFMILCMQEVSKRVYPIYVRGTLVR